MATSSEPFEFEDMEFKDIGSEDIFNLDPTVTPLSGSFPHQPGRDAVLALIYHPSGDGTQTSIAKIRVSRSVIGAIPFMRRKFGGLAPGAELQFDCYSPEVSRGVLMLLLILHLKETRPSPNPAWYKYPDTEPSSMKLLVTKPELLANVFTLSCSMNCLEFTRSWLRLLLYRSITKPWEGCHTAIPLLFLADRLKLKYAFHYITKEIIRNVGPFRLGEATGWYGSLFSLKVFEALEKGYDLHSQRVHHALYDEPLDTILDKKELASMCPEFIRLAVFYFALLHDCNTTSNIWRARHEMRPLLTSLVSRLRFHFGAMGSIPCDLTHVKCWELEKTVHQVFTRLEEVDNGAPSVCGECYEVIESSKITPVSKESGQYEEYGSLGSCGHVRAQLDWNTKVTLIGRLLQDTLGHIATG